MMKMDHAAGGMQQVPSATKVPEFEERHGPIKVKAHLLGEPRNMFEQAKSKRGRTGGRRCAMYKVK